MSSVRGTQSAHREESRRRANPEKVIRLERREAQERREEREVGFDLRRNSVARGAWVERAAELRQLLREKSGARNGRVLERETRSRAKPLIGLVDSSGFGERRDASKGKGESQDGLSTREGGERST